MEDENSNNRKMLIAEMVLQYLLQVSKWSEIYSYLKKNGYEEKSNEKINKKALLDNETAIICLVVYVKLRYENETFTVRSLAKQLDSSDEKSTLAKARKIRRLLDTISQYNIIDYYTDSHKGDRTCIKIEATDSLIVFIETLFFTHKGHENV